MDVYYRSIQQRRVGHLTVKDYLWRGHRLVLVLARVRRAGRTHPPDHPQTVAPLRELLEAGRARTPVRARAPVRPAARTGVRARGPGHRGAVERAIDFFDFFVREVGISPFWLCPLHQRDRAAQWELYPLDPGTTYVNFGFWSTVSLASGQSDGAHNRRIERVVEELDGRKSLYSTSYEREEFWRVYNGAAYDALKESYDSEHRLLDLYQKCVERG